MSSDHTSHVTPHHPTSKKNLTDGRTDGDEDEGNELKEKETHSVPA
jgi:hypothetical protein